MANIELVIKIPESQYKTLNAKSQADVVDVIDDKILIKAIKGGVPLPKGHGKLIDADELKSHIHMENYKGFRIRTDGTVAFEYINNAPTIIEADKGE